MSYHDEQMRKRCEESSTYPSSKGHIPTFHGPMFPCEKCKELEAAHAATLETLREVTDALVHEMNCHTTDDEVLEAEALIAKARSAQKGGDQ
tara:strand:+ start:989 stop:1264 length:276 start_codon:yes stop_codon:yes gene_type:complete